MPLKHKETPYHGKTLTVAGLIEELQKFSPHLPVLTEGCDCYGDAFRVTEESGGTDNFVLIEREPIMPSGWRSELQEEALRKAESIRKNPDVL